MRKDVLSNKIAKLRIKHLLKEGYTKVELSRNIGLAYKTIENILDPKNELIRFNTHEKIGQFCAILEEQKANEQITDSYFLTDEDIIDRKDAEEGAKEVTIFICIVFTIALVLGISLILLARYIISLF